MADQNVKIDIIIWWGNMREIYFYFILISVNIFVYLDTLINIY
jgi:hypothetical protein